MEQYYILLHNPSNNTVLVAEGNPGGEHLSAQMSALYRTPVYIDQDEILLYKFNTFDGTVNSVSTVLGTTGRHKQKYLIEGNLYLNIFQFTTITPSDEVINESTILTIEQLRAVHKIAFDTFSAVN